MLYTPAGVPGGTTSVPVAVSNTGTDAPTGAPGCAVAGVTTLKVVLAKLVGAPFKVSATEPVPVPVTTLPTLALPVAPLTAV